MLSFFSYWLFILDQVETCSSRSKSEDCKYVEISGVASRRKSTSSFGCTISTLLHAPLVSREMTGRKNFLSASGSNRPSGRVLYGKTIKLAQIWFALPCCCCDVCGWGRGIIGSRIDVRWGIWWCWRVVVGASYSSRSQFVDLYDGWCVGASCLGFLFYSLL
jgi:hypothetical protein